MRSFFQPPRFHVPAVFGVQPGNQFFLPIPVEGEKVCLNCVNPPPGSGFDASSGTLSGRIAQPGAYRVRFEAENPAGRAACEIRLIAGNGIQLTPPMGWNSWYCFSEGVSDTRIRMIADALVERGLAAHGWTSVNIDDCWQGKRGGKFGALQGNERFPDMKALVDYVHRRGLRFGLYSTPWISTYAGFRGGSTDAGREERLFLPEAQRLQPNQVFGRYPGVHELKVDRNGTVWKVGDDIRQWAEWGVDFVKMDWNPNDLPTTRRIATELRNCGRDIVLSLSNNAEEADAAELLSLAQLCRVSPDIKDTWESISGIGFSHASAWQREMGPGRFPDLDMLQIGAIGVPNTPNPCFTPTRLTPAEQRTQFTLWCLLSAPLLLSCDIAGMDEATFQLLTNDALIAIDQDPLAVPPKIRERGNGILEYRKPLADGSTAIALFNRSDEKHICRLEEERDGMELWSGEELELQGEVVVAPHAVRLYRTTGPRQENRKRTEAVFANRTVACDSHRKIGNIPAENF